MGLIELFRKEKVLCCLPLVKKTRDLAVLTGILLYKTKRIQDILTNSNIELNVTTLSQLIVDKLSKTDLSRLFFAAQRVRLIGDYPIKGFML